MQDEPVIMVIGEGLPRMEENRQQSTEPKKPEKENNSNTEERTEQKMPLGNMEIDNEENLPIMNALMCSKDLDNTIEVEIMDDNKNVLKKLRESSSRGILPTTGSLRK